MTLISGHWPRSFILALIQKRPSLGQKPFISISGCNFYQDRFVMCLWTFSIFSCTAREEASRERTATTVPCDGGHIYTENLHPQRSQQSLGITSYICRQSMEPGLVLFLMCIVHAICCFIQNRQLSIKIMWCLQKVTFKVSFGIKREKKLWFEFQEYHHGKLKLYSIKLLNSKLLRF